MRKKIKKTIPKENLLGFDCESDLYNRLLEKSSLVFPEYKTIAKMAISRHLARLIISGLYFGDELVEFPGEHSGQLLKYFKKLADNGFITYKRRGNERLLKLNVNKIKEDWLNIECRKEQIKAEPKENLLGCMSESDLYNKLLKKSNLVFPKYGLMGKKCVCRHLTELIESGRYSGDRLVSSHWARNAQLTKHLRNMAKKGFLVYGIVKNKGALKLNTGKIKKDWLNIDHQKTNDELEKDSFNRAKSAANEILDMMKEKRNFDITCRLEFLLEELKSEELEGVKYED